MPSTLAALLCVGLCLSCGISTQKQTLSRPLLWAEPDVMVPEGSPVTIWCQGPLEAVEYRLLFEGGLSGLERPKPPGSKRKVKFLIPAMTSRMAGTYSCFYQSGELWSEPSNTLDLVVTGLYDTPTLTVHPGPEVTLGENVTFRCRLETATNTFFLLKEGRSRHVQRGYGNLQAEFPVGPVTSAHRGTYRCFGSYNNHAWSFPSEPVRLLVTDVENTSLALTDPTSPPDSWDPYLSTPRSGFQKDPALWNYTTQNLLWIALAFLVLVALVWILAEDWLSRKRAHGGTKRDASGGRRRRRLQSSLGEQPADTGLTLMALASLSKGTITQPSPPHTSPCNCEHSKDF